MKTLVSMKKNLVILLGAIVTLSLTACPSNSPQNGVRQRGMIPAGVTNPTTGQYVTNLQWGAITTTNGAAFSPYTLSIITNGATLNGTVSGIANDQNTGTGIEFRGQVNQNTGQGEVDFAVWDSQAATTGLPLYWPMQSQQVQQTSNGANMIVQGGSTTFVFQGTFSNGLWIGQFGTLDSNNNFTPQANFQIAACSIFSC